jgi:LysM repeat protein
MLIVSSLLLGSCTPPATQVIPTSTSRGLLTPYATVTPSPTRPIPTVQVTPIFTPSPTPTPYLYTVKKDDTMLGIAFHFGITLQDLQAANPTVDPHFMSQGIQLVIPIVGPTPEVISSPTPLPIEVEPVRCIQSGDGGAWCIVAIKNSLDANLENLSVLINLYDEQGEVLASQTAIAPLNILRSGSTMPVMAYFAPPLSDSYRAQSELVTALAVNEDDARYLDPRVQVDKVEIGNGGTDATVSGEVLLPAGTTASQLWLLAVAYDANGNIIGMRKWKSAGETEFSFTVFSLADAIDHVEVLAEARP